MIVDVCPENDIRLVSVSNGELPWSLAISREFVFALPL
jgi:hypothetical protein